MTSLLYLYMHKEKLPRATHGGMAGQRDAARARGRRTRVHARVLTWSRSRPGTMLPARLHLEHAARQAASEALGQPGACCWLASDLGMVEHSCGESGGGDGRLVAPRSALVAASRVAQREEQLSSKSRWAAIVRRREGATAVFRRRCRSWPATRKLFAGGVTADRNVTAGSGVATRSGLFGESQVSAPRVGRGRNRASRPDRPLSRETSIAANKVYKRTPQLYTSHGRGNERSLARSNTGPGSNPLPACDAPGLRETHHPTVRTHSRERQLK